MTDSPFSNTSAGPPTLPTADLAPGGGVAPPDGPKDSDDASARPAESSRSNGWLSWFLTFAVAITVALLARAYLFEMYQIPTPSMAQTLRPGDRVLVNKLSRTPEVGDIVVFDRPANDPPVNKDDPKVLIKRVMAVGGDTIDVDENGAVLRNGSAVDEPYLADGIFTEILESSAIDGDPFVVPDGKIVVMGDNRINSADSRRFGPIDVDLVVGTAELKLWPLSDVGGL